MSTQNDPTTALPPNSSAKQYITREIHLRTRFGKRPELLYLSKWLHARLIEEIKGMYVTQDERKNGLAPTRCLQFMGVEIREADL